MIYGLPDYKKFPMDTLDNIKKCIQYFDTCPEYLKEELATNVYYRVKEIKPDARLDENHDMFRYVNFKEEIIKEEKSTKNEDGLAVVPRPQDEIPDENKYIDGHEFDEVMTEDIDFFSDVFGDELLIENTILNEATSTGKRKEVEDLIYKFFNTIDVTGRNAEKYKQMFSKMSNEQFDKYMKKFLGDENQNFYLEVLPNKNEPNLKLIKKCADLLKVPLDEYVYYRHDGDKDQPIRTSYRVPVGLILAQLKSF